MLRRSLEAGWSQPSALRIGVLALPLLAYAGAVVLEANGFVAAFIAGVFFEPEARRLPHGTLHLVEDVGQMLSLALWFIFGAIVNKTLAGGSITWQIVLYAVLALTVVRVLPVVVSLAGTDIAARDRFVLGWVGPRGIATLVFGMLAFIGLAPARGGSRAHGHRRDGRRQHRHPRPVDRAGRPAVRAERTGDRRAATRRRLAGRPVRRARRGRRADEPPEPVEQVAAVSTPPAVPRCCNDELQDDDSDT